MGGGVNGALTPEQAQVLAAMKLQVSTLKEINITEVEPMFMAFNTSLQMETYFANNSKNIFGGVWFENDAASSPTVPFKYSIRVDSDKVNNNEENSEKDWDSDIYRDGGFSSIQVAVDQSVLLAHGMNTTLIVSAGRFPDPYTEQWQKWMNGRKDIFLNAGSVFITAALFIFAFRLITELVIEKETKIREGMKMMGLNDLAYFTSWLVTALVVALPTTILIFLVLRGSSLIYHTSYGTVFILFVLYLITLLLLGFIASVFFDKSKFAGILTFIVVILLNVAGIFIAKAKMSTSVKYLLSLISPIGIACSIYSMAVKDLTMIMTVDEKYVTSTGGICGMFLVDIAVYIILLWYLDNVVATEYGSKRKWYFPFTLSYWLPSRSKKLLDLESSHFEHEDFEMVPLEYRNKTTVSIRNLRKEFHTGDGLRVAVDDLSLDFYEDQIHSYLGHNGSGKSTTIGMLTGLITPTKGDAVINGYSINSNLSQVRRSLGVCLQQDILWNDLTVLEHLRIYASLKGVAMRDIEAEATKMAKEIGLEEKMNAPSKTLSGGQKRKLCLGIAFIGRSTVIFIDEATSGMDPLSRRGVWDFLLKYKKGRTIVLTTHFMDEADFLGDRIAIISHGKLKCDGSSLYLKNRFGVGYLMTISKIPNACDTDSVTKFVHGFIPEALILSDAGTELSYRLPTSSIEQFVPFFRKLDEMKASLGIGFYGISVTTLEEVFLRIGQTSNNKDFNLQSNDNSSDDSDHLKQAISIPSAEITARQQLKGLIIKRMITSSKDLKSFILTILLPLVVIIGAIVVYKKTPMTDQFFNTVTTPLTFNYDQMFGNDTIGVGLAVQTTNFSQIDQSPYFEDMLFMPMDELEDYLIKSFLRDALSLNFTSEIAAQQLHYTALFARDYLHALPVAVNVANDALLRSHDGVSIQTTSRPFAHVLNEFETAVDGVNMSAIIYYILIFIAGYALMAGAFAGNITTERITRVKRLLYISGCKKYVYWMSNLLWDYFFAFILLLIASVVLAIVEENFKKYFGIVFVAQILYCIAIIPLAYLLSYRFTTHGKSLAAVFGVFFGMGIIFIIAILNVRIQALLNSDEKVQLAADILDYIFFSVSPLYCLSKVLVYVTEFTPVYRIGDYTIDNIWAWNYGGAPLFFLGVHAIIWTSWIILLDYVPQIRGSLKNPKSVQAPQPPVDEDSDVSAERQRLMQPTSDVLVMKGLHKLFPAKGKNPAKIAVYNSTLGIPRGQTFGLLGLNGAGKSTTLSMLTMDVLPTSGQVSINGHDLITERSQALSSIGYCMQFDALIPLLSAREQLALYCRIKGIPEHKIETVVNGFVQMMDLKKISKSNCGGYSGGNKRKLSLSIAMLGNPSVVFLDEPSTGTDPQVRRFMWNVIAELGKDKVIIITTHSLEECEALCNRTTIMKDGAFQCLGSNQWIKSKFGSGYSVDIKFKKEYLETGVETVLQQLPGSKLLDKHDLIANFELANRPERPIQVSEIFAVLQTNLRYILDDFSVSQISLEQIFLKLTGSNYESRMAQTLSESVKIPLLDYQDF